ncbi:A/G-specific adenine glycosylase [Sporosarcina highlanderae]|uniref:Adenine DNA glycosylase n=1 Tax=Sporosarcina highlanderae TaxID=3035916 RepID=A0ABT8JVJ0_9BACL|nr:A/G-specific adenine glycosylase [Sporosarcina highlanderae]MDN4608387.1 A/G-specific adenine glycosylase [Sporosarcina highlanderae]
MQLFERKSEFRSALITWYLREKRDLPWRRTDNPYYIWVSEVMLQQTRVDTVIPYYERFIEKFPSLADLAVAKEEDVLKMWEGLGYYSRVKNLQSGVREVVEKYGSEIPKNRKEISKLKGVGPYTAGAVLSIAFGVPEHAVDGNVMRVLSRLLLIEDDIAIPRNRKIFEEVVMELIDEKDPSSFNQALMELGATICTPKPRCLLCPVRDFCHAFHEGRQEKLPVKSKKTKVKTIPLTAFAVRNSEGKWLMKQRPSTGLLADMWEFPMIEITGTAKPEEILKLNIGIKLKSIDPLIQFKHVFSHLIWEVEAYLALTKDGAPVGYSFFSATEVDALPKAVPVLKIWDQLKKTEKNTKG